jgi:hypothetical protein
MYRFLLSKFILLTFYCYILIVQRVPLRILHTSKQCTLINLTLSLNLSSLPLFCRQVYWFPLLYFYISQWSISIIFQPPHHFLHPYPSRWFSPTTSYIVFFKEKHDFLPVWDKSIYTGSFLLLFPCTYVLQPQCYIVLYSHQSTF